METEVRDSHSGLCISPRDHYRKFFYPRCPYLCYKKKRKVPNEALGLRKGERIMINAEFLKKLMDERGISRKALAIDTHLTESCISRILSGQRAGSLEVLETLATVFPDVDLRSFLKIGK